MLSFQRLLFSLVIVLFLPIVATHCFFEFQNIHRLSVMVHDREKLLQEKKANVRDYREKVEFYSTDEGMKHLAREQYGLFLTGERVIILTSGDSDVMSTSMQKF